MFKTLHRDALHFGNTVKSYWESTALPLAAALSPLQEDLKVDVAIIGGGFTGLSAAIELAQQGLDVCVLEAGAMGWGASGRNGGFACIGSHKLDYGKMIKRYGSNATKKFYGNMRDSVELVRDASKTFEIDIDLTGQGEVTLAHSPKAFEGLKADTEFLAATFGENTTLLSTKELKQQGLNGPEFFGGLKSAVGFGIHPLNYVRGLAKAAHQVGAKIFPSSKMMRWTQSHGKHHLYTDHHEVRATRVLIATNGYTPEDLSPLHRGRVLPALSNILVTRQLTPAEMETQGWTNHTMAYDSRDLLHYFRLLPDNRFLFGGRGGTDASDAAAPLYQKQLAGEFHKLFPAWAHVEVTHFWRGNVCLSFDRVPYIGSLDDQKTVWTALAYHGNGVAMGSWSGRTVARMMQDKTAPDEVSPVITRRLAKFPLPMFRPLYLKAAYVWYGWKDGP